MLAADYEVAHTTLLRYFRRPEVKRELKETERRLPAQRAAERAERAVERQLEQALLRRAEEEAARDRELQELRAELPVRSSDYLAWLDQRELPGDVVSADNHSAHDRRAAEIASNGGGVEQVIEAAGLRSRVNVYRLDAQIMARALENDRAKNDALAGNANPPESRGLRRLVPDAALLSRRARGESLRQLASDYGVCHSSLCRYFRRPEVAREIRSYSSKAAPSPSH